MKFKALQMPTPLIFPEEFYPYRLIFLIWLSSLAPAETPESPSFSTPILLLEFWIPSTWLNHLSLELLLLQFYKKAQRSEDYNLAKSARSLPK